MSVEVSGSSLGLSVPQPAPAAPSGGITSDTQARTAITDLITALTAAGVLE